MSDPGLENILSHEITSGGSTWHPGMWLPAEPTQASDHHGRIRPRDRTYSIDITVGEDVSLDD
jgi:hypothetical protein